ncbi:MAG: GGDEF domain-containing protein [Spirochaetia bacterium]|jgi:diguanylate cyclase (GGDEF)-like protein|nr:GGDEF domain-containing protein [Spirochaetia bacterium]
MIKSKKEWFLFLFLSVSSLSIIFFTGHIEQKSQINDIRNQMTASLEMESSMMMQENTNVLSDLLLLKSFTMDMLQNENGIDCPSSDICKQLTEIYTKVMMYRDLYDQIRFINADGMEKVRVKDEKGHPYVVPQEQLEDKSARYYFHKAIGLPDNGIYISPLDLNIEQGQIELKNGKQNPLLRVATPIFYNNKLVGLIIINYRAENILTPTSAISMDTNIKEEVLNADLSYLQAIDPSREFGFMYGNSIRFSDYHDFDPRTVPQKDKTFIQEHEGKLYGIHIFSPSGLLHRLEGITQHTYFLKDEMRDLVLINVYDYRSSSWFILLRFKEILISVLSIFVCYIFVLYLSRRAMIRQKERKDLQYRARYDFLTGLINRKTMIEQLSGLKQSKTAFSILFLDLDNFKQVNDQLGHEAGDQILKETASRLKNALPKNGTVSRFGGDEFLLEIRETDKAMLTEIALRLISYINQSYYYNSTIIHIGASIGIDSNTAIHILGRIKNADEAMYTIKRAQKNSFAFSGIKPL